MKSRLWVPLVLIAAILIGLVAYFPNSLRSVLNQNIIGKATVASRLNQYGEISRGRLKPAFEAAHLSYPPRHVVLLGLKNEKQLEIYARNAATDDWKFVQAMPVLRASGKMGPKLREGDLQVPEGFYRVESLNPKSAFHLSLRVSYPSTADRQIAEQEHRDHLGGDIMIHGGEASVGCLAMGDDAAQDLFVLAADSGIENVQIVLCPLDFRESNVPKDEARPQWVRERYAELRNFVRQLPKPQAAESAGALWAG